MEREQTAIEFLMMVLQEEFPKQMRDIYESNQLLAEQITIQAKQMEKEQMKEIMWDLTDVDMTKANKGLIIDNMFKQYYESKYGKDE